MPLVGLLVHPSYWDTKVFALTFEGMYLDFNDLLVDLEGVGLASGGVHE